VTVSGLEAIRKQRTNQKQELKAKSKNNNNNDNGRKKERKINKTNDIEKLLSQTSASVLYRISSLVES